MKKRGLITTVLLVIVWYALALLVNNNYLVPNPLVVMKQLSLDLTNMGFYQIILASLIRLFIGIVISLLLAIPLGLFAGLSKKVADYLAPINAIVKAVPSMSYIIILLIWCGAEYSVILVSFLILFPIVYTNVYTGVLQLDRNLQDVMKVYPAPLLSRITKVYIPQILPFLWSSLKVGCGLGIRVCIMAEAMTQVKVGVGKQIYYAKNMLDMTTIFSWTIWMILLSILVDVILEKTKHLFNVNE